MHLIGTESTISYTIGILIALVVILGSLVLVLSLPYIYKCRRMKAGEFNYGLTTEYIMTLLDMQEQPENQ